jgi:hypothetical protein
MQVLLNLFTSGKIFGLMRVFSVLLYNTVQFSKLFQSLSNLPFEFASNSTCKSPYQAGERDTLVLPLPSHTALGILWKSGYQFY